MERKVSLPEPIVELWAEKIAGIFKRGYAGLDAPELPQDKTKDTSNGHNTN